MPAILCDISRDPIEGEAWETQLIHGRAVVNPDTGHARIVQRDGATVLFLSEIVGRWPLSSPDHARDAYDRQREASARQPPAFLRRS